MSIPASSAATKPSTSTSAWPDSERLTDTCGFIAPDAAGRRVTTQDARLTILPPYCARAAIGAADLW